MSLRDKTFLVTGARSGIGLALAHRLADQGGRIVVCTRLLEQSEQTILSLPKIGSPHIPAAADMASMESIETLVSELKRTGVTLDGVSLCAGVHLLRPLKMMKPEHWVNQFAVNTMGPAHLVKTLLHHKIIKPAASIVFVSSIAALKGEPAATAYSGSKAALIALTRSFAYELASQKIRVNCISPGVVETNMSHQMFEKLPPDAKSELQKRHPLGFGAVEDIVLPMCFLLSEDARWITGQNLIVDGGFSIT